jgi:hypothetical protein
VGDKKIQAYFTSHKKCVSPEREGYYFADINKTTTGNLAYFAGLIILHPDGYNYSRFIAGNP